MKSKSRSRRPVRRPVIVWPGPMAVVAAFVGLLGATFAYSHAAASTGLVLEAFRPLGGSFFAWRTGHNRIATKVIGNDRSVERQSLEAIGRQYMNAAPLTPRALWFIGLGREARGDAKGARSAIRMAERLSRREGSIQLWLAKDALRRNDATTGLRHFDILLRTIPAAGQEVLPQLSMAAMAADGRRALRPYMRKDNPWLSQFLVTAVDRLPQVAPLGSLLAEPKSELPDTEMARAAYSTLSRRLAAENAYDVFVQLYPRLPSADRNSLNGLGLEEIAKLNEGYAPAIWDFGNGSDRGGTAVQLAKDNVGIEFFAASGTVGIAGQKLVNRGSGTALRWTLVDRVVNADANAQWLATCVGPNGDGRATASVNLAATGAPGVTMQMALPTDCPMVRIDFRFAGGTGTQPSNIVVGEMQLVSAVRPARQ